MSSATAETGLFEMEAPPPRGLMDRFGMPPFSVLNRRTEDWQDLRRRWLRWGIESEIGRAGNLLSMSDAVRRGYGEEEGELEDGEKWSGTSIFDPVICELAYRWYCPPGGTILDPFAGGSVRGVVAGLLERRYMGIDLRGEQIRANRIQAERIFPEELDRWRPKWATGDSRRVLDRIPPASVDFMWSCPPYADLEVYSDDPADLSQMEYEDFLAAHAEIIAKGCAALKPDRFAAWVISDVRDKQGIYRGLGPATIDAFRQAGLSYYNEAIIVDSVGSGALRAARIFNGGRKLTRMHQYFYIFVKGNPKRAAAAQDESEQVRT